MSGLAEVKAAAALRAKHFGLTKVGWHTDPLQCRYRDGSGLEFDGFYLLAETGSMALSDSQALTVIRLIATRT